MLKLQGGQILIERKKYFQFGLRIETEQQVSNFIEQWNNNRYHLKMTYPILESMYLREAEMQTLNVFFPIGYFQGTTKRGVYDTIKEELSQITEVNTEASFQKVNQKGINPKVWEEATEIVRSEYISPNTKEF